MAQADLLQALDLIKELSVEELHQVHQAVQGRLATSSEAAAREASHLALLDAGLVKEIETPPVHDDRERPLVTIRGKPLSQTIVEERS